jgi:hypothetical protein
MPRAHIAQSVALQRSQFWKLLCAWLKFIKNSYEVEMLHVRLHTSELLLPSYLDYELLLAT